MKSLLLIGGGGHCKACIDVIEQSDSFRIGGIVDSPEKVGKNLLGYPYVGTDDDLAKLRDTFSHALVTVGQIRSAALRIKLYTLLCELGYDMPVVISPLAYVSRHSRIAKGTIVMHHAIINAAVTVGKNCIINTKALIEHDATIESHCHISTASIVNGGAIVKSESFYGSNAVCKEGAVIELGGFVKAGSVVK